MTVPDGQPVNDTTKNNGYGAEKQCNLFAKPLCNHTGNQHTLS